MDEIYSASSIKNRDKQYKATILAIDDAKDILVLLESELSAEGYRVLTANNGSQGLKLLSSEDIDLVLLDILMPEMSGPHVLRAIKQNKQSKIIPVIMLSASEQSQDIVSALDLGADDYITKPYIPEVLFARIRTSLRFLEKNRELEKMASIDFLTGINNRRQFYHLSNIALNKNIRDQSSLTFGLMDIDYFKNVNDTYGHDIGDLILVEFSKMLSGYFRGYDIIGRIGGEEFCVCLPDTIISKGFQACERFREAVSKNRMPVEIDGRTIELSINISIGITSAKQVSDLKLLIKQADKALYAAKNSGRNKVYEFQ
jgi:diguanylate cyclase (GGDEF)-like protein